MSNLSLEIADGEFLVIVGPSGCGKSTTLRMAAGLEPLTEGEILIDGEDVTLATPRERNVAMVFQNYALYPHMTVTENIGYPLKVAKIAREARTERIAETARMLRLSGELKKRPSQLSGGQRQRVAMGRALVRRPRLFILDEPLSNLDAQLRVQMRGEITALQREVGVTTLYVTHDQVEAMTMADRVAVMHKGVLQQVGPPQEIFDRPDNLFVATFMGSPSMNLVTTRIEEAGGSLAARVGQLLLPVPREVTAARPRLRSYIGREVALGLRPSDIEDAELVPGTPAGQVVTVRVDALEGWGPERVSYFTLDAPPVTTAGVLDDMDDESREMLLNQLVTRAAGRFDSRNRFGVGTRADVAINMQRAHFFELRDGLAIAD